VGSKHARVLIFRERAAIETMVLEKGYVAAGGKLRGEKWLIPNHSCTYNHLMQGCSPRSPEKRASRGHMSSSPKVISRKELALTKLHREVLDII
jgi:hypothetical protein